MWKSAGWTWSFPTRISEAGLQIIRNFEGLRLTAYCDRKDAAGRCIGVWTIGYGHTGADVHVGQTITRDQAVRWFTANPAWVLGLDSIVGTLEPGKMADVVLWSADPLSVYARAIQVYNDGWLVYDRNDPAHQPKTDFTLGQP